MKFKSILAMVLTLAVVVSMTACSNSEKQNNSVNDKEYETEESSTSTTNMDNSNIADDNNVADDTYYDIYITSGEPYEQGVLTTTEYYSKWLNIYCDIPSDLRPDEETLGLLETINQYYGEKGQIEEMVAFNSDNTIVIYLYAFSVADNGTLDQYIEKHYQELEDSREQYSVNGIQITNSGENFSTYSFLGENYLLNTYQTETRYNGELSRALNYWDLFRVKGDRIIQIQFMANQIVDIELDDFVSMFTTYDAHFNPDSTSNNESNSGEF